MTIEITINPLYPDEYAVALTSLANTDGCSIRKTSSEHYGASGGEHDLAIIVVSLSTATVAVCSFLKAYLGRRRITWWRTKNGAGGGSVNSPEDLAAIRSQLEGLSNSGEAAQPKLPVPEPKPPSKRSKRPPNV